MSYKGNNNPISVEEDFTVHFNSSEIVDLMQHFKEQKFNYDEFMRNSHLRSAIEKIYEAFREVAGIK